MIRKLKPLHYGKIQNGKLIMDHPESVKLTMERLEGQEIQFLIEKRKKQRSNDQNAYYWGVIVEMLADEFGYTKDEMHEALKWQFLRVKSDHGPDTVRSTSDLSTAEFEALAQQIRDWALVEYNVNIPKPNEDPNFIYEDDYFL